MTNPLTERFGSELVIKNVIIGGNLNLAVIRGFASLDQLAYISAPDVYNQLTNEFGTQRFPDKNHAAAVLDYALTAVGVEPQTSPRAFPEILLNARDASVVGLKIHGSAGEVEFDSNNLDQDVVMGDLILHTGTIDFGREKDPQISRVDGNHRLLTVIKQVEEDPDTEFPIVPFAMFVGLSADQERALFRDVNGEQKPMQTAHLDSIKLRLQGPGKLLQSETGVALWLARQLTLEGYPFEGQVYFGGDKKVFKEANLPVPPVAINALKGAVQTTLKDSRQIDTLYENSLIDGEVSELTDAARLINAKRALEMLSRYWNAVRIAFPEAWQDRSKYILMQAIGLNGFSRLGAVVIDDLIQKRTVQVENFNLIMQHVATQVSLSRDDWEGYAGLAGAKKVFGALKEATVQGFDKTIVLHQLEDQEPSQLND